MKEISYVISVSAGKGCYRHIRIDGSCTLFELHECILDAFEFFDDHAHAFFMNNRAWDESDAYYAEMVDEDQEYRHTSDVRLKELGLAVGGKFLYVFDFGEEWRFACRVLKVLGEATAEPEVVRCVGEPPEQYGLEEDDWDMGEDDEE